MRTLEHRLARARLAARRLRARLAPRSPSRVAPARLVLDLSAPAAVHDLPPAALRRAIVEAVDWRGPLPVTLSVGSRGDHPLAEDLIRFAHRLECATRLVTTGGGVDPVRARALVDRGLESVRLVVAERPDDVSSSGLGARADVAGQALEAFLLARSDRGVEMDVEVGIPWTLASPRAAPLVASWATETGADGVRLLPPHSAAGLADTASAVAAMESLPGLRGGRAALDALEALLLHGGSEPGLPRSHSPGVGRRLRCPVGGQRLELDAAGIACCCPHKEPIGRLEGGLAGLWQAAGPHLDAIHECARACVHIELAPESWTTPALARGPRIE